MAFVDVSVQDHNEFDGGVRPSARLCSPSSTMSLETSHFSHLNAQKVHAPLKLITGNPGQPRERLIPTSELTKRLI